MQIQTHILTGWCAGNLFKLDKRERFLCMAAALAPDLDGLGMLWDWETYLDYHHVAGHGILFCLLFSLGLAAFSPRGNRTRAFLVYLLMGHIHILEDFIGSGIGWGICYFWPFSMRMCESPWQWPLFSWQNILFCYALVGVAVVVAVVKKRTPLEWPMPELDRKLVVFFENAWNSVSRRKREPGKIPAPLYSKNDAGLSRGGWREKSFAGELLKFRRWPLMEKFLLLLVAVFLAAGVFFGLLGNYYWAKNLRQYEDVSDSCFVVLRIMTLAAVVNLGALFALKKIRGG